MWHEVAAQVARAFGLKTDRAAESWRWSDSAEDYYPVEPRPRWGHGRSPNPYWAAILEAGRSTYIEVIKEIGMHRDILHGVPQSPSSNPAAPYWDNTWFSVLDAASLVGLLCARKPRRYLEIGSGNSTSFARYAIEAGSLNTRITSIDPHPRREINDICDEVHRTPLERCDLGIFDELEPGDLLFFDGSHRVFANSDVTTFFFDVLPRVKPGVLVHIHDIFLPEDYPPEWNRRLYSEQYILGAMLLCSRRPLKILLPNYFVCKDAQLSQDVRRMVLGSGDGQPGIPFLYNIQPPLPGVSCWLETAEIIPAIQPN